MTAPKCPKCGGEMVIRRRRSDGHMFWGCKAFPNCRGSRNYVQSSSSDNDGFKPSVYQQAVFDAVKRADGNYVVEAVAGSGKTTTIVHALEHTPKDSSVAFVAFNRHIAKELARRAPAHVKVSTLHSLGFAAVRQSFGNVVVDQDKVKAIVKPLLADEEMILFPTIRRIVALAKATLSDDYQYLCDRYGVETNGDQDRIFELVDYAMAQSMKQTSVVDFDDMCWLPVVLDLPCQKFDWLFVDETQDLNNCQIELVLRSVKETGHVIAVGDRHQSLYGFRGADTEAIPNVIKALNADTLPLSITYRCPKSHVRLAQQFVPTIEPAPWAGEGKISNVYENDALRMMSDGDLVLCRCNAPLVRPAFALIRQGRKAVILGRDIGKGLKVLIEKMKAGDDIHEMLAKLADYRSREVSKLMVAKKTANIQSLEDKVDTIVALADGCESVSDVMYKIDRVFSDDARGVVFSSVHRAKGLEAERVFILRRDLMPHPRATQPWEQEQERNIQYVAFTRSKSELIFVI